jgi:hypothetical protein
VAGLEELSAEAQSLLEGTPMSLTVDGNGASIESKFFFDVFCVPICTRTFFFLVFVFVHSTAD